MIENSFCVPVCVRDGESLVKITVAGVEFQIGITEFRTLIGCTMPDTLDISGPTYRGLGRFLHIASNICEIVCSLSPPVKSEDMERNRKRWAKTGIGGVQELEPITAEVAKWNKAIRDCLATARESFIEGGQRII